jgi:hypothetical protein
MCLAKIAAVVGALVLCADAWALDAGSVLNTAVPIYEVEDVPIEEALGRLLLKVERPFVVGFEQLPSTSFPVVLRTRISLRIEQTTVGEVLRQLCSRDPRYAFSEVEGGVINVYPVSEPAESAMLLNMPLNRVDVAVREWPGNLFARITEFAPELRMYLNRRAREYQLRSSRPPLGTCVSSFVSDLQPPLIEIHLRASTVRGALNAFAAYTLAHTFSDDAGHVLTEPRGWSFQFIVDADADTGLGGYPRWSQFPFP